MKNKFGENRWKLDFTASVLIVFAVFYVSAPESETGQINYKSLLLVDLIAFVSYLAPCVYFSSKKINTEFVSWLLVSFIGSIVCSLNLSLFFGFSNWNNIFLAGRIWEDLFTMLRLFSSGFILLIVLTLLNIFIFRSTVFIFNVIKVIFQKKL